MLASYSPVSLSLIAALVIVAAVAVPPLFNGVTVLEAGKHRVWFSRKGWVYDYDRLMAGTYGRETVGGVVIAKSTYWSTAGNWPWAPRS